MLCLCDKASDSDIDGYKDYTQVIRKKEFEEAFLLLDVNTSTKLKEYIHLLTDVKLDSSRYHVFYGELKIIVNSFLSYYTTTIDNIIKDADTYSNVVTKQDLVVLVDKTILQQQTRQDEFRDTFREITKTWEKEAFEETETQFKDFTKKLNELKEVVYFRLDKQSKVDDFAKNHFAMVVKKMSEIFDTTHLYVGKILVDNKQHLRVSLEEILLRLRNNLKQLKEERDDAISGLMDLLYEKNKESMYVARNQNRNSIVLAEATRGVENIRNRIENYGMQAPMRRLEKEIAYWSRKLDYFYEISNNLDQLRTMQRQLAEDQENLQLLKCKQIPGCKNDCMMQFRVAFSERAEELRLRIVNETRAMVTFFAVRGADRVLYTNKIGSYYVDEYNHQNYCFDHGLKTYHVNCDGEFTLFPDYAYLFDKYGRYIMKDGEKLYQIAPCTSQFKLNEGNCFDKVTKDCGHSERINRGCHLEIKDPNDVVILPNFNPLDIKSSLDRESVRYLWASLGCVLPDALRAVGAARPRNPIHLLAHKLLHYKYKRTISEQNNKKKAAEEYRANIFKERKEKAEAASAAWRSTHGKRSRPEDSDDAEFRAYLDARLAQDLFINALNRDLY